MDFVMIVVAFVALGVITSLVLSFLPSVRANLDQTAEEFFGLSKDQPENEPSNVSQGELFGSLDMDLYGPRKPL